MGSAPLRLNGSDAKGIGQVTTVTIAATLLTVLSRHLWPGLASQPEIMAALVPLLAVGLDAVSRLFVDTRTPSQRRADRLAAAMKGVHALEVGLTRAKAYLAELQTETEPEPVTPVTKGAP